jgi:hypothetical protein
MRWLLTITTLLVPLSLHAQPADLSGVTTKATGGTTQQTLATRFAERVSVRDFGAACDGTTDDSGHLAAAADALANSGRAIYIPGNCRILMAGASQVWLRGEAIVGDGIREYGTTSQPVYGLQGSSITIAAALTGSSPFTVSSSWALRGIEVFWAGQTEVAAIANSGNAAVYPALIVQHGSDNVVNWDLTNDQIDNAYDVVDLSSANTGYYSIDHNQIFAMHSVLKMLGAGGEGFVANNFFDLSAYTFGSFNLATHNLRTYASLNEDIIYITGNGTSSTQASLLVTGLHASNNYVFEARRMFHIVGGALSLSTIVGDTYDTVGTPIEAGTGGNIVSLAVTGGNWNVNTYNNPSPLGPALLVASDASPDNSILLNGVQIAASIGKAIVFNDTKSNVNLDNYLNISGGSIAHTGIYPGTWDAIDFTGSAGTSLNVTGVQINTANSGETSAFGINIIGGAPNVTLAGNTITGFENPINTTQTGGRCTIVGNVSSGSLGTALSVTGSGAPFCNVASNNWDQGNNTLQAVTFTTGGSWTPVGKPTMLRFILYGQGGCGGGGGGLTTPFTGAGGGGGGGGGFFDTGWFPAASVSGAATISFGTACTATSGGTAGGNGFNGGGGAFAKVPMTGMPDATAFGGGGGSHGTGGSGATASAGGGGASNCGAGDNSTSAVSTGQACIGGGIGTSGGGGGTTFSPWAASGGAGTTSGGVAGNTLTSSTGSTGGASGGGCATGTPQAGGIAGAAITNTSRAGGTAGGATGGAGGTGSGAIGNTPGSGGSGGGGGTTTGGAGGSGGFGGGGGGGGGGGCAASSTGGAGGAGGAAAVIAMAQ